MIGVLAAWRSEIAEELTEATAALQDARHAAAQAIDRAAVLAADLHEVIEGLKALPASEIGLPITGRLAALRDASDIAALDRRRHHREVEAAAHRVERLESAMSQLSAVLIAASSDNGAHMQTADAAQ